MTLPVDEMVLDLQTALEAFQDNPGYDTLDLVFAETRRIDRVCEDELPEG